MAGSHSPAGGGVGPGDAGDDTSVGATHVVGHLTDPDDVGFDVYADASGGICAVIDGGAFTCTGYGPGSESEVALTDSRPDRSSLHYGFLPEGVRQVVLVAEDGTRTDAEVSADGSAWALADPSPTPMHDASDLQLLYVGEDGTEVPVPAA